MFLIVSTGYKRASKMVYVVRKVAYLLVDLLAM
jgi:hypothetical protein